ncbi:transglutaminase-like cysteine peptidase (plasmid) [Peteryoungia desertarenae]|uniref:Transglutaminase-like cysteine peptidase n=1 Tax=Peteryoungia desertarenae TaxID=1813451 RepID=A0ABX6QTY5_9HYPH|nr:transglutaminase-like cysteine peptidase [Peteryoungia desertarenae]QLF71655.1 transglutaminase-like cysteine peptidase [Peteryoungia desertarenae]
MANKNKKTLAMSAILAASFWAPQAAASPALSYTTYSPPGVTLGWIISSARPSLQTTVSNLIRNGLVAGQQLAKISRQKVGIENLPAPPVLGTDNTLTGTVSAKGKVSETHPASSDVFGSVAIPFKRLGALKKAAPTFAEIQSGRALDCRGSKCPIDLGSVRLASADGMGASIRDRMNRVNLAVNRAIRYQTDSETYGKADRWASPSETLKRSAGDCEDYALLKMAALAAQGVPLKDMSLVVLYDQKRSFYHAVLSVEVQGRHYILDNLRDQILLDTQLPDYMPLFSISAGKGYIHGSRIKNKSIAANVKLDNVAPGEGARL